MEYLPHQFATLGKFQIAQAGLDDGKNPVDHPETAKDYFQSIYFEALKLVISLVLDNLDTNCIPV